MSDDTPGMLDVDNQSDHLPQNRPLPHLFIGLICFYVLLPSCASSSPQVVLYAQSGESIRVSVEVADTPEKRQYGLMYRKEMPQQHGMLFLFPKETPQSFWMKNTILPLDIVYINAAYTIVHIARNTTPFSEKPIPSGLPAQFVLEVNAGFCQRHGIRSGDRVEFVQVPDPPSQ